MSTQHKAREDLIANIKKALKKYHFTDAMQLCNTADSSIMNHEALFITHTVHGAIWKVHMLSIAVSEAAIACTLRFGQQQNLYEADPTVKEWRSTIEKQTIKIYIKLIDDMLDSLCPTQKPKPKDKVSRKKKDFGDWNHP